MYDIEREKKILEILEQRGTVGVNRLASLVYCSGSTIRRDLAKMEKKGLVKRFFGSVTLAKEIATEETSYSARETVNITTKKCLAKKASSLISNSQIIFLDSSTTVYHIVPFLNEYKNILVITNGLKIATEIAAKTQHKVVLVGGEVQPQTNSILGSEAINQMSSFHADIAIMSCTGVSFNFGFSEASYDSALIKKQMIKNSNLNVFVFEKEKFGQDKAFKTCELENVDCVVVPNDIDESIVEDIKKLNVRVLIASKTVNSED